MVIRRDREWSRRGARLAAFSVALALPGCGDTTGDTAPAEPTIVRAVQAPLVTAFTGTITPDKLFVRPDQGPGCDRFGQCTTHLDGSADYYYFVQAISPGVTGTYSIEVTAATPSTLDPVMFLYSTFDYSGTSPVSEVLVSNDDQTASNLLSKLTDVPLDAGQTYYIVIAPYSIGASGEFEFQLNGPGAIQVKDINHFDVAGFTSPTTACTDGAFTVQARDRNGKIVTGYRGTVQFSSSDPLAVMPPDYTFAEADNGVHTFTANFHTATATQALTVRDTQIVSVGGTLGDIAIRAAALSKFTKLAGDNQSAVVNTYCTTDLSVLALDGCADNPVPGVAVTFAGPSSGPSIVFDTAGFKFTRATDAAGIATAPKMRANAKGGSFLVTATTGAIDTTFSLSNKLLDGALCQSADMCLSANCIDGVCCNTPCSGGSGDCQACNLAGHLGECTPRPADAVCRGTAGSCDIPELCDGTNTACPNDVLVASGAECRPKTGVCDIAEVCTGTAADCPADAVEAVSTVCRASAGDCDLADTCDGAHKTCPADKLAPPSTVCRSATDACDAAESCTGTSVTCPADGVRSSSFVCRSVAGPCDLAERCDGAAKACPADVLKPSTAECRSSVGACDVAELCTGSAASCPADVVIAAGTVCRAEAGPCDVTEVCSGSNGTCPSDAKRPSTAVCRASAGDCDVSEYCDGSGDTCPSDGFKPASTICRAAESGRACDLPETCAGDGPTCPATDLIKAAGTVCRGSAGDCDLVEKCDGAAKDCPADTVAPAATPCRAAAGDCDLPESCDGANVACPADARMPSSTVCRAGSCSAGVATAEATCAGATTCPPPQTASCGSYGCAGQVCAAGCGSDADCDADAFCDAGTCVPKKTSGVPCANPAQCASAYCVDGVCCDAACSGQCEACNESGFVGQCVPVDGAPRGGRPSCLNQGTLCGGSCDGEVTSHCTFPGEATSCREGTCANGVATLEAACSGAGTCPVAQTQACDPHTCNAAGTICLGDCVVDSDCTSAAQYCSAGVCVDKLSLGVSCGGDHQCAAGYCVDGVCCDTACEGQCEACDLDGALGVCSAVSDPPHGARQPCESDGTDCGGFCNGLARSSCTYPGGETLCREASCEDGVATWSAGCDTAGHCPGLETQDCAPYACGSVQCAGDCEVDADCNAGSYCAAGVCKPKLDNGETAHGDNQCLSGKLADGVCCDTDCLGQCEACDLPNSKGACTAVVGAPRNGRELCASDATACGGSCDGALRVHCAYPGASVECRGASCNAGVATAKASCDGTGSCPDAQQIACPAGTCEGSACKGDCATTADCTTGYYCVANVCLPKATDGELCAGGDQCASGICVDGVCCKTACDGQCEACDVSGAEGTCTPVDGAPHGGRTPCEGIGTCGGACDGTDPGACSLPSSATICAPASCTGGVALQAAGCGNGTCGTQIQVKCAPYACAGDACAKGCTGNNDCADGAECVGSICVQPDGGLADAGVPDSGADGALPDGSTPDEGGADSAVDSALDGAADGAMADAGLTDGGSSGDASKPDGAMADSGLTDGGSSSDASKPDGALADAGKSDGSTPDDNSDADPNATPGGAAGGADDGGCGCRTAGTEPRTSGLLALLALAAGVLTSRRRRSA